MELIKVTKKGSIHFKLDDGRLGVSYNSGYIRVSVKGINNKLYQINKKIMITSNVEIIQRFMSFAQEKFKTLI